jgi:hypothetical protein
MVPNLIESKKLCELARRKPRGVARTNIRLHTRADRNLSTLTKELLKEQVQVALVSVSIQLLVMYNINFYGDQRNACYLLNYSWTTK